MQHTFVTTNYPRLNPKKSNGMHKRVFHILDFCFGILLLKIEHYLSKLQFYQLKKFF